jgi:hypothetical protein
MEALMSRTYSPAKLSLALWFWALALAFGAQQMSAATVTYIVGTCKSGTQFSAIQSALDASPAPDTVEVCPGQYAEQLTITKPVTLEGITASNGSLAQIVEPPAGYTTNATVFFLGTPIPAVAQIYVNNVSGGTVNLTNLDVYGAGSQSLSGGYFIGIVYEGSSGTINQVVTSLQEPPSNGSGLGMWIEGGSSNPSVTVENSSLHDFSSGGILVIGTAETPNLTTTIKNNLIDSDVNSANTYNLTLEEGSNAKVTGNFISGGQVGVFIEVATGSVTGNTIFGSQYGVELDFDGVSVTSNNIYGTGFAGIDVEAASLKASVVENNTIKTAGAGNFIGIDLECNSVSSSKVNSNTIMDSFYGYGNAPAGFGGSNTYIDDYTNVNTCDTGAVSKKASARLKLWGQSQEQ